MIAPARPPGRIECKLKTTAGTLSFDYQASSDCGYQQPHNTALSTDG